MRQQNSLKKVGEIEARENLLTYKECVDKGQMVGLRWRKRKQLYIHLTRHNGF